MNWSPLKQAVEQAFIDGREAHRTRFSPLLIDNQSSSTMSRAIIAELRHADSFVFSVAFIYYSRNSGASWYVVWGPFLMAGGAFVIGIPVYLAQRSHMAPPQRTPAYR